MSLSFTYKICVLRFLKLLLHAWNVCNIWLEITLRSNCVRGFPAKVEEEGKREGALSIQGISNERRGSLLSPTTRGKTCLFLSLLLPLSLVLKLRFQRAITRCLLLPRLRDVLFRLRIPPIKILGWNVPTNASFFHVLLLSCHAYRTLPTEVEAARKTFQVFLLGEPKSTIVFVPIGNFS